MKIKNWKRKIATGLVAAGLLAPAALSAQDLNTNLIVDSGFEDVDPNNPGKYGSLGLNSWADGSETGGTYMSGQYDNGGPLAGGGDHYFSSNFGVNAGGPGEVTQIIDVSTGPVAAAISSGNASYSFGAFFTTYLNDLDRGHLHLDFLDGSGASLGTAEIAAPETLLSWTELTDGGTVPAGTLSVQVSVFGTGTSGGPDGYIDNAAFLVSAGKDCILGDINLDGTVSLLDVSPFVQLITGGNFQCEGDVDQNGVVDLLDVEPFVQILTGG